MTGLKAIARLDDFGTGYSSLDHFRRLPAQEIKIDRSFVSDMLTNADDEMIVKSIISLSKNFKRRVVAEGIETQAMQDKLIDMGCEQAQGFCLQQAPTGRCCSGLGRGLSEALIGSRLAPQSVSENLSAALNAAASHD
ncbi:EAL domain-containing protein [Marinobacter gelidimuriae]|uniref:EAL domain-containing protein n=1 Tax=Marinobacter gelidimuriae TaxID=2739064 RepID=UPI00039D11FF|nr:EAL domain-containing protein [Marinobacter gelidimuriae]